MGRDKALLEVDGVPMARRVAEALRRAGARSVQLQGGDPTQLGRLGFEVVADDVPGGGPFPAVVQATERAGAPLVAVLACDLVRPSSAAVRQLVDALAADPAALAAVPLADGHEQWVHGTWRRTAAGPLRELLDGGCRSMRRAAAELPILRVSDVDPGAVHDADRPEDLPGGRP